MGSTNYYALRDFSVEQSRFLGGDEIGSGDVERGEFSPADKCVGVIDLGHVIPRLGIYIGSEKPAAATPKKAKATPPKAPKAK